MNIPDTKQDLTFTTVSVVLTLALEFVLSPWVLMRLIMRLGSYLGRAAGTYFGCFLQFDGT